MSKTMKSVCVYCGSNPGRQPAYLAAADTLAQALVERNLQLVYGGAKLGIMGALADRVLALGGQVIGVIPEDLVNKEIAHTGLTKLHVTKSMHERKTMMVELADAFVAMPGGVGTLEELFEVWTWAQLGLHEKPCGLFNVAGYFDSLSEFLAHTVAEEFVKAPHLDMLFVEANATLLLDGFASYQPPEISKWVERTEAEAFTQKKSQKL
ncbi:MAG: TIGR00730 family Rossman fold protein [Idiomarina sp.]